MGKKWIGDSYYRQWQGWNKQGRWQDMQDESKDKWKRIENGGTASRLAAGQRCHQITTWTTEITSRCALGLLVGWRGAQYKCFSYCYWCATQSATWLYWCCTEYSFLTTCNLYIQTKNCWRQKRGKVLPGARYSWPREYADESVISSRTVFTPYITHPLLMSDVRSHSFNNHLRYNSPITHNSNKLKLNH